MPKISVYNINKAIGSASSGVEYAQYYRHKVFQTIEEVEDYYIFLDYISTNLCTYTDQMGYPRERIIGIYQTLSHRLITPCSYPVEDYLHSIAQPYCIHERTTQYLDVILTHQPIRYRIWLSHIDYVDHVDLFVANVLERVEHYDCSISNIEYYQQNKLIRRVFYRNSGDVAFMQLYQDNQISQTLIDGMILEGRVSYYSYFFQQYLGDADTVVIVDRALDVVDAIYPVLGQSRLFCVIHAEHYDQKYSDQDVILWNNHYEHVLTLAHRYEALITSTPKQCNLLTNQLKHATKVACIPVGIITSIQECLKYDRYRLITASRLASEKHIDLLIRAVSIAQKRNPKISLDIYGEGNRSSIEEVIQEINSSDYIHIMGHHSLDGVYQSYGLYVSASTSEGFGLSIMEAISEGLPVVGFEVDYGNTAMIESGVNGLLLPYGNSDQDIINLADAIIQILECEHYDMYRRASLQKAQTYEESVVRELWRELLC